MNYNEKKISKLTSQILIDFDCLLMLNVRLIQSVEELGDILCHFRAKSSLIFWSYFNFWRDFCGLSREPVAIKVFQ